MREQCDMMPPRRKYSELVPAGTMGLLLILATLSARSEEKPAVSAAAGSAVGHSMSEKGMLVRRDKPGGTWQVVNQKEALNSGELLVGLPGAQVDAANRAVRLTLHSDLQGLSPYPIHESAVRLLNEPGADLSLELDRGRVDLANQRTSGAAKIRLRVRQDTWTLTLAEPGTRIALELYGQWLGGVPFTKQPGPKDVPTASLIFLVLKGSVDLEHGGYHLALGAPPGPALIEWDSVNGQDHTPQRLDKLPPWAHENAGTDPALAKKKAVLERFRQLVIAKSPEGALDEFLNSDDPWERRLAVFGMGALDNLIGLGKAIRETKYPDVWDNGILALRHWIGRGPGQDQRLYQGFIEVGKFPPIEAETVLQLLHNFGDAEIARPELYETLIQYLNHDKLAIRGLAYWHLKRLVPAGKKFGYDPYESKEARAAAIKKWKELIPEGKMPPRPDPKNDK
jgi:hypothetical protein